MSRIIYAEDIRGRANNIGSIAMSCDHKKNVVIV